MISLVKSIWYLIAIIIGFIFLIFLVAIILSIISVTIQYFIEAIKEKFDE